MSDKAKIDYGPPSPKILYAIKKNVEVLKDIGRQLGVALDLDADSIEWLDGFINRNRESYKDETLDNAIIVIGSFLGEAIIARYGGEWIQVKDGRLGVALKGETIAFPITKVEKQFTEGEFESIFGFYVATQTVINHGLSNDKSE